MITSPLKWVGGKGWMKDKLIAAFTPSYDPLLPLTAIYIDPFCGGLAPYLAWCEAYERARMAAIGLGRSIPPRPTALLGDANPALIVTYVAIRAYVEDLATQLDQMPVGATKEEHATLYYAYRTELNTWLTNNPEQKGTSRETAVRIAALVLWINRNCFNGLWRVNAKGGLNAAVGDKPRAPATRDELVELSTHLRYAKFHHGSYKDVIPFEVGRAVVLYLDPPYAEPDKDQASPTHTSYTAAGFTTTDQLHLAELAVDRARYQGFRVVVSNHDSPEVLGMFPYPFRVVDRPQRLNRVSRGERATVGEVLLVGDVLETGP